MNADAITNRIERMEQKIDKLVDAVTELVRVEATLQHIDSRLNTHSELIKQNDLRLDKIEQRIPIYEIIVNWGGKVAMTVSIAIVLAVIGTVMSL